MINILKSAFSSYSEELSNNIEEILSQKVLIIYIHDIIFCRISIFFEILWLNISWQILKKSNHINIKFMLAIMIRMISIIYPIYRFLGNCKHLMFCNYSGIYWNI